MRRTKIAPVALLALAMAAGCATTNKVQEGRAAAARGDYVNAERLFRQALKDKAEKEEARVALEYLLLEQGRDLERAEPEKAEALYREVLEQLDPKSVEARVVCPVGFEFSRLPQQRQQVRHGPVE